MKIKTRSDWIYEAVQDVHAEIERAIQKHGLANVPLTPSVSVEKAYIILSEEVGEVARALTYDEADLDNLEKELVQTAAMAVSMLIGVRKRRLYGV